MGGRREKVEEGVEDWGGVVRWGDVGKRSMGVVKRGVSGDEK